MIYKFDHVICSKGSPTGLLATNIQYKYVFLFPAPQESLEPTEVLFNLQKRHSGSGEYNNLNNDDNNNKQTNKQANNQTNKKSCLMSRDSFRLVFMVLSAFIFSGDKYTFNSIAAWRPP